MLKKGDVFIGVVIVIMAIAAFSITSMLNAQQDKGGHIAVITLNGKIIKKIDLDKVEKERSFRIDGIYTHEIQVKKGEIRFSEAGCPDKVCVGAGFIKKAGEMAVCLPDKLMIKIDGNQSEVDSVSH